MGNQGKGKTILIVILFLAVVGLAGYIVYDKIINKEVKPETNTEGKVIQNTTIENKTNLFAKHKSIIQSLHTGYVDIIIDTGGNAYLRLDTSFSYDKRVIEAVEGDYQKHFIEGYHTLSCFAEDEREIFNGIKLPISKVVAAYNIRMGTDQEDFYVMFLTQDGTLSRLSLKTIIRQKEIVLDKKIQNLSNIATVVQSATSNECTGSYQVLAIESDGTEHLIYN